MAGTDESADVVVLGLGVGGEAVAGDLAEAGLDVVGVDHGLVGGECPYWGCIPTKMMVRAAGLLDAARHVDGEAGTATVHPGFADVAARVRDEATDDWNDRRAVDRLTGKGVRFVRGTGRLDGEGTVVVVPAGGGPEVRYTARVGVVLATGTRPYVPPIDGLAGTPYWTNREAVEAPDNPRTLAVLGGGAIGLELAQACARFGSAVTVIEPADRLLAMEEPEASALLDDVLRGEGLTVRLKAGAARVDHDERFTLTLTDGTTVEADRLLVATGRRVDLAAMGAATIGVPEDARALPVDEHCRVRAGGAGGSPAVWAVGDVTGHGAFTHVAMYESAIVTRAVLHAAGRGDAGPPAGYAALPRVTFTDPEVGAVGLTEARAREAGLDVRTGLTDLAASTRGWIHRARGFVKVVEDASEGVLVGATAAGPMGGEVMSALAVAVHGRVPVERLRRMIYAYPTFHRAIESALADLVTVK